MSKYKFIIIAVVVLLLGFLAGFLVADKKAKSAEKAAKISQAVDEALGQKSAEKKEVKEIGKPGLIYFYAQECSSCQKFKPNWNYLKKKYKNSFNFIEVDVDNAQNAPLFMEFMVNVIPYVYIEDVPFRNRVFINPLMYQYLPRFELELNRYLEMREILKKGVS